MRKNLFFAALAVSVVAACSEQLEETPASADGKMVNLEISVEAQDVAAPKVKAAVDGSQDNLISGYRIFIFNDQNALETSRYVTVTNAASPVQIGAFSGKKTIYAIANETDANLAGIYNFEDYCSKVSSFSANSGSFVMEGGLEVTISGKIQSITIPVKRLVSKVTLVSIKQKLQGDYSGRSFRLNQAYLINLVAGKTYHGDNYVPVDGDWRHKMGYHSEENMSSVAYTEFNKVLEPDVTNTISKSLYCYPNPTIEDSTSGTWCPRHTRLVVEASIDNKTYYYPITLPVLKSNTQYQVVMTITGPGTNSPDMPYNPSAASVVVKPVDWASGDGIDVTI